MNVRTSHEMACPECGADTDISIMARVSVKLLPYGELEQRPIEWHDRNPTMCGMCGHVGEVQDFALDREHCEP